MGADEDIHTLMRIESADVDEPPSTSRKVQALSGGRYICRMTRTVCVSRCFVGYANTAFGNTENRMELAGRKVRYGQYQPCLPRREANLAAPEHARLERRQREVRKPFGDCVVQRDDRPKAGRQRKIGVDRRREENVQPLICDRSCQLEHIDD